MASKGNYIIKRDRKTGAFIQVKIFFKDDPGFYVRIFQMDTGLGNHQSGRSKMDIFLFDQPVYRDITIPLPFSVILTEPFSAVIRLTSPVIDWSLLVPDIEESLNFQLRNMVEALGNGLNELNYAEDGAIDEHGNYVFISDLAPMDEPRLNCSGLPNGC